MTALDTARKTKGVTDSILSRCIESLTAAETAVDHARIEESQISEIIKGEVSSLLGIQKESLEVCV